MTMKINQHKHPQGYAPAVACRPEGQGAWGQKGGWGGQGGFSVSFPCSSLLGIFLLWRGDMLVAPRVCIMASSHLGAAQSRCHQQCPLSTFNYLFPRWHATNGVMTTSTVHMAI